MEDNSRKKLQQKINIFDLILIPDTSMNIKIEHMAYDETSRKVITHKKKSKILKSW